MGLEPKREFAVAAKHCSKCNKPGPAGGTRCAYCGSRLFESNGDRGPSRGVRNSLVLVFMLIAANIYAVLTRETGPAPELEALHSSNEAVTQCQAGIEARFSDRGATVEGLLEFEYLQGGEYVVRGTVRVRDGRRWVTRPVLCEAQFRVQDGWVIEHVEVGS